MRKKIKINLYICENRKSNESGNITEADQKENW
jgi:hypothetical protein